MGFFPPPAIVQPADTTTQDLQLAGRLAEAVRKHRKVMRPIYVKNWAKEFAKLRTIDKLTPDQITIVLDWYVRHFNKPYIPQAYSASSFRGKFEAILRAQEREAAQNPTVEVTELARCVAQDVKNDGCLHLPIDQFASIVQVGINNTKKFIDWVRSVDWKNHPKVQPFVEHYLRQLPAPTRSFHERWWADKMRWASDKGVDVKVVRNFIWQWDSDDNRRYLNELGQDWGSVKAVDRFREVYDATHG